MKIICDTREQEGHEWAFGDFPIINRKLESGDYSLEGLEDVVCLERKKSPSEVAINIGKDKARFVRELERMKLIPFSYLICEFSLTEALSFPKGSNIPKSKLSQVKITGKYIVSFLSSLEKKYGIKVIYAGDRESAIEQAISILNTVWELNNG